MKQPSVQLPAIFDNSRVIPGGAGALARAEAPAAASASRNDKP